MLKRFIFVLITMTLLFQTGCFNKEDHSDKTTDDVTEQTKDSSDEPSGVDNKNSEKDDNDIDQAAIKLEIEQYIALMYNEVLIKHDIPIDIYDDAFVNAETDEKYFMVIIYEVIPMYTEVRTMFKDTGSTFKSEEIQTVHNIALKAVEIQLEGFSDYKTAWELNDNSYMTSGTKKINLAKEYFVQYHQAVSSLANKYQITLNDQPKNKEKEELTYFASRMFGDLLQLQNKANQYMGSVTGSNYTSDERLYEVLIGDVIPTYSELVYQLEEVATNLTSPEVLYTHSLALEAVYLELDAYYLILKGIETGDDNYFHDATQLFNEAQQIFEQLERHLILLEQKYIN